MYEKKMKSKYTHTYSLTNAYMRTCVHNHAHPRTPPHTHTCFECNNTTRKIHF